jgi:gas vesicle protein
MGMNSSGRILWFAAGVSIGATLAILFAPQSGKETREYLGYQARRGREALDDARHEAFEKGRELFEKGRTMADDAAAEALDRGRRLFES